MDFMFLNKKGSTNVIITNPFPRNSSTCCFLLLFLFYKGYINYKLTIESSFLSDDFVLYFRLNIHYINKYRRFLENIRQENKSICQISIEKGGFLSPFIFFSI